MIDRSLAPTTQTIDNLIFKNPTNFVLRNRIPAFVFESSLHEVLKFDLVFDAGTALQTSPLVAGLTLKMLRHGTKTYPGSRFSTQLESCGAYIQQHITKDDSVITFLFLKKNLLKVLPLIESLLNEPSFSENEFRLLRRTEKEEFIVSHEKPRNQAAKLLNTKLFGENLPYGWTASPSHYDSVKCKQLTAHYRQYLGAANCRIVLSGPVDQDVIRQVDTFLGENWNPEAQKVNHLIKTQFTSGISKVERKGALQTAIQIGRPIMQRLEPEYPAFLLLNTVLGGYFGSRLMTNIREDKGYTYGIHSQVNAYRQAATLIIATEAGAAVSEATHHEIAFEMNRLQTETIEKEELELVKSYLTGSYLKGLDGVYNLAEKFRTIQAFGLSLDYYPSLLKKIQDTGADELQELAKKYLILDQMTEVWVGAIR